MFLTNHVTLKPSIRSSFSKIGPKNSLFSKLLIDYNSSIVLSTSNIIVTVLNISVFSTSAGSNSIQVETQGLPFEVVTNTVKHKKIYLFCQKPECLHVVNNSAIAQLCGIKLIQLDIKIWCFRNCMPVPSIITCKTIFH